MKKVLVTGAGGTVGLQTIRFLLSEGKYEITALELKDKHVYKRLKRFRKRINIVYGDVNDGALIDALIKEHDIVIHLAGVLPHLANIKEELCKEIDYRGTMQIVDSIKDYNPDCFLLYASSTSIYGIQEDDEKITVKSKANINDLDYYSKYKMFSEDYIKENIKNYSILRLSYVLADPDTESLIYNVFPSSKIEFLSAQDAGYVFANAIEHRKALCKKTYNVSGGDNYKDTYRNFIGNILTNYGVSIRFLSSWLLAEKNYYEGYYSDGEELEKILKFRSRNINTYYNGLKKYKKKPRRFIPRLLALPFIFVNNRKIKKGK